MKTLFLMLFLSVITFAQTDSIRITWTDPVDAAYIRIMKSSNNTDDTTKMVKLDSVAAGVEEYTWYNASIYNIYWFSTLAVDASNNVSSYSNRDSAIVSIGPNFDNFSDTNYTSGKNAWKTASAYTVSNSIDDSMSTNDYALVSPTGTTFIYAPSEKAYGIWEFDVYFDNLSSGDRQYLFIADTGDVTVADGYKVVITWDGDLHLIRILNGAASSTLLQKNTFLIGDRWYRIKITRNSTTDQYHTGAANTFAVYLRTNTTSYSLLSSLADGSNPTAADATYTTSKYFSCTSEQTGDRITNILMY